MVRERGTPVLAKASCSAQGYLVGAAWAWPGGAWGRLCCRRRPAATSARLGATEHAGQGTQRPSLLVWVVCSACRDRPLLRSSCWKVQEVQGAGRVVLRLMETLMGCPRGEGSAEEQGHLPHSVWEKAAPPALALKLDTSVPPRVSLVFRCFLSLCPLAGAQGAGLWVSWYAGPWRGRLGPQQRSVSPGGRLHRCSRPAVVGPACSELLPLLPVSTWLLSVLSVRGSVQLGVGRLAGEAVCPSAVIGCGHGHRRAQCSPAPPPRPEVRSQYCVSDPPAAACEVQGSAVVPVSFSFERLVPVFSEVECTWNPCLFERSKVTGTEHQVRGGHSHICTVVCLCV